MYNGYEVAANETLVKFRSPVTQDMIAGAQVAENVEKAEPLGSTGALRFRSTNNNVTTLIRDLSARADVEYAEPNYIVHALETTPNDPRFGELYGMTKISAPSAWDISNGSTANVVAVIDSGIDYTHPDLAANIWSAPTDYTVTIGGTPITCPAGSHGFNAISNTCDPMDDHSHGTHVSGTIGAVGNNAIGVAGVNWNASIIGAKFLSSSNSGTYSDAINAIDYVIQIKKKFGTGANVRVLSNSWGGGGYSQALLDEINNANENDMLFVASAGNDGSNNDAIPHYPSSYNAPNVVAVAATDVTDSLASFSNYGLKTVHLGAPGVHILSTIPGGSYGYNSGTSMATPHVSGAAALILSNCTLDTGQLKATILDSADQVPSLYGKTVTGGRLNVNKAIRACSGIVRGRGPPKNWTPRAWQSSVVLPDGSIVLMGGAGTNGYDRDVWRSTDGGANWTLMNASAGWTERYGQGSVAMPDASILLFGGTGYDGFNRDVWRSTDNGTTWGRVNASAGWTPRAWQNGVILPDGSITLMAGSDSSGYKNDVWRFQSVGSLDQNPVHTYTQPGNYTVGLQAYNNVGWNNTRKEGYITVLQEISNIGVFRPSTHLFYLDYNGNGAWNGALIDRSHNFGLSADVPVTGDWNGDGKTEIGIYRPSTHMYYLDWNGNGAWNGALTDKSYTFGITDDVPVSGDWNGDGKTEIGIYRPSTHMYYLDWNGNGAWNGGVTDRLFNFGLSGDYPVAGDWDN